VRLKDYAHCTVPACIIRRCVLKDITASRNSGIKFTSIFSLSLDDYAPDFQLCFPFPFLKSLFILNMHHYYTIPASPLRLFFVISVLLFTNLVWIVWRIAVHSVVSVNINCVLISIPC
jgi:hypothetical protein